MDRSLPLLVIGLIFGGAIGFTFAASQGITLDGHHHGNETHTNSHEAHHEALEVPDGTTAPTIAIAIEPDPVSGWNLEMQTTNFRFSPENAGQDHKTGEGHGHLYIDDTKTARLYGPWFHIPTLPSLPITITVGLYTNDHRPLGQNGTPIQASVIVEGE